MRHRGFDALPNKQLRVKPYAPVTFRKTKMTAVVMSTSPTVRDDRWCECAAKTSAHQQKFARSLELSSVRCANNAKDCSSTRAIIERKRNKN